MGDLIPLANVSLFVRRSGPAGGTPVIFVHGVMMSGQFFERQLGAAELAPFNVVVPDMRGHGESEKPLSGHTVASYASDLGALIDSLHLDKPVLVGWSMGVMVVYEYLKLRGQDSVRGIVIAEQTPSDYLWEDYSFGFVTLASLGDLVADIQTDMTSVADHLAHLMLHEPSPEVVQWMTREITKVPPVIGSTIFVNQTIRDDRDFLPSITVPTLVMFGRDPKLTPPEAGEYISEQIHGSKLEIFENSSHCPFYEESELFNRRIRAFVDSL